MLTQFLDKAPLYLLVAARCLAMFMILPLFSTRSVSTVAKVALAGYVAFILLPTAFGGGYEGLDSIYDVSTLQYVLLLVGEGLIGIITGFFITMLFAAFSSAGQFFSFQMGLSAAEAYDALSQVENPLMGQLLNLIAMFLFFTTEGFQQVFLHGMVESIQSMNAMTLVVAESRGAFMELLLKGLSGLFFNATMIALPLTGTFFLVSVSMGLLSKAAPQMNLLSEGIPLTMLLGFLLLFLALGPMCDLFIQLFDGAFVSIQELLTKVGVPL